MTERRAVEWDQRWRVALIDPGDFTPAYDLALAKGFSTLHMRSAASEVMGFMRLAGWRFGTSTFTGAWIVP